MVKQGRTSDSEIAAQVTKVKDVIARQGWAKDWSDYERAEYLADWGESFRAFADDLESRPDMGNPLATADRGTATWPGKLREVAAEAERAAEVYSKDPEDRLPEEVMFPGMATSKEE